jgi:hypothetical protein
MRRRDVALNRPLEQHIVPERMRVTVSTARAVIELSRSVLVPAPNLPCPRHEVFGHHRGRCSACDQRAGGALEGESAPPTHSDRGCTRDSRSKRLLGNQVQLAARVYDKPHPSTRQPLRVLDRTDPDHQRDVHLRIDDIEG